MSTLDDLYHNCRSCHWFDRKTQQCNHGETFQDLTDTLSDEVLLLSEDGIISAAIEESFSSREFKDLKAALENSPLSKKKAKEIYNTFLDELSDYIRDCTEAIDENVTAAIRNNLDKNGNGAPMPEQPDTFYCKYFE